MRSSPPRRHLAVLALVALAAACGDDGAGGRDDPEKPGLAFESVPATASLNGRFAVTVRLNDGRGQLQAGDSLSLVSIRAGGGGVLQGTLTRRAVEGRVVFDDLSYDHWEAITLTATSSVYPEATTRRALPVRPLMRFVRAPLDRVLADERVGPFDIELVDGRGRPVQASQDVRLEPADGVDVEGGGARSFSAGAASYPSIAFRAAGSHTLVWTSPGLADLLHPVMVYAGQQEEGRWMRAARVNLPYRAVLPARGAQVRLLHGALPRGLKLELHGEVHGVPTEVEHARFEVLATPDSGAPTLWKVELSVFPASEPPLPIDTLDGDGPFAVAALDDTMPVPPRRTSAALRVFYPAQTADGGQVAEGVFPLVVFHHGAAVIDPQHPTLYDRYDHLLRRWASHGLVVATIDGLDLVWSEGRLTNGTLANLNAMAENQRAAIAFLRGRNADPGFALAGHIDAGRVIVAGHSRGAGAALITARAEPAVVGGVLIKPLDPMTTVGGATTWLGPLPAKPFLIFAAGNDGDVPYPMVDYLYERRAGPMASVTILGSDHFYSCDTCAPEPGATPTITRAEDWAVTNAYSVAFLKYVAFGDMGRAQQLFGAGGLSCGLSQAGVLVQSDRRADALLVDDFQDTITGRNDLGLGDGESGMTVSVDEPSLLTAMRLLPPAYQQVYGALYERPDVLALSGAHHLTWQQDHASYRSDLGGLDVRGRATLAFRARSDDGPLPAERVQILLEDGDGHGASLSAVGRLGGNGLGGRFADLMLPLADAAAAGVDLQRLATLQIVLGGRGTILIDDVRFE